MEDKYLEALENKRENARNEWNSLLDKAGRGASLDRKRLRVEIQTYTDCIELYKSMKGE